jgi:actin-like ATPase involved in cell morphogenesis
LKKKEIATPAQDGGLYSFWNSRVEMRAVKGDTVKIKMVKRSIYLIPQTLWLQLLVLVSILYNPKRKHSYLDIGGGTTRIAVIALGGCNVTNQ